ncbi:MAG: hypothetical protein V4502_13220 [Pseudomonadota bacterium]
MSGDGGPLPAIGHIPFGHRSVAAADAAQPVALVRFTTEGEMQLGMFGDGFRFLVIDERCPEDRVYELTAVQPRKVLEVLVPAGTAIGSANDERHDALVARMEALFTGRPHLTVVGSAP